jgi:hypothetical protein
MTNGDKKACERLFLLLKVRKRLKNNRFQDLRDADWEGMLAAGDA